MEKVFSADQRKWISPLTKLGEAIEELKQLVRLRKECLVVIDPTSRRIGNESGRFPNVGRPEFMDFRTSNTSRDVENEAKYLKEELARKDRNKWSISEEACVAAVASVGGPGLFEIRSKKKKGKKRGNNEEADEEEDEEYSQNENTVMDVALYEKYNYGGMEKYGSNGQEEDEISILEMHDEKRQIMELQRAIPEALTISDDEDDLLIYDNEMDNYTSVADRYKMFREKFSEMKMSQSDEDDSDEERKDAFQSQSDDEDNRSLGKQRREHNGNENSSEPIPGTSKSQFGNASFGGKDQQKQTEGLLDVRQEPMSTKENNGSQKEPQASSQAKGKSELERDSSIKDFQRFTDWVFLQTEKRNKDLAERKRPDLMKKFNLSGERVKDLQRLTSTNLISVKGEVFQDEPVMKSTSMPSLAPPVDLSEKGTLQSLTIFITHGDDPSAFPWKSINVQQQMNDDFAYDQYLKRMEQQKMDMMNPAMKDELVDKEQDFLVHILVYQATDPDDLLPDEVKVYVEPKLAYELFVLGSQSVADIMKAIHCENDHVYLDDVSHPDHFVENPKRFAKNVFPSRLMLIHDTVFTDPSVRDMDYVTILNEWAKTEPAKRVGPFKSGDWNTKLKDVELRFGQPYVFSHLGGCEHIIVFTKAKILNLDDEHLKRNYPKINGMTRFKNVYCRVDNEYLARWAVLNCQEFPENPMLLCTECVLMYCYDKQKKKRGNFRLYPFTQMANIL